MMRVVVTTRVMQLGVAVMAVCFGIVASPLPTKSDYDGIRPHSDREIRRAILVYAKRYRLDPAFLRAVIKVESDFRPDVVSRKGAVGLMQLTPDTAATLQVVDPYDPIQNVRGGAKQLRHLLNLYHEDLPLTLAAYNAGVHRVKGRHVPRIRETKRYVGNVLKYYDRYKRLEKRESGDPATRIRWKTRSRKALSTAET